MTYHALVVDDSPDVLDDVKDRLEGLGHTCDRVTCLQCAREHLAKNSYSYILLDLEIPVRYGRPSRIQNGQNLLREVREMKAYKDIPIIVMTSHGHDSPDLAVEVLRCDGATDFVKKMFADRGHTLETAIRDALVTSGRSHPGAIKRSGPLAQTTLNSFEHGEMSFSPARVELCGVKICGDADSGMVRRILDVLREKNDRGRYKAYSGSELADKVRCDSGQNGVSGAIRDFRRNTVEVLRDEANIVCGLRDVIQSGGRGYRLTDKIAVCDVCGTDEPNNDPLSDPDDPENEPVNRPNDPDDPLNDPVNRPDDPVNGPNEPQNDTDHDPVNPRQRWILDQLQTGSELRIGQVIKHFECSTTSAKRDLADLRRRGLIAFEGPPRTGAWKRR